MDPADLWLWKWLPLGYAFTVAIELPILLIALSRHHPISRRVFCGFWLTACTYPVIILVMPQWFDLETQRGWYLVVAEIFAPLAECLIFTFAFKDVTKRDWGAIIVANLASFGLGEVFHYFDMWSKLGLL